MLELETDATIAEIKQVCRPTTWDQHVFKVLQVQVNVARKKKARR
jgi:hypothetical protein